MNDLQAAPNQICCIQEPDGQGGVTYSVAVIYTDGWIDLLVDGVAVYRGRLVTNAPV